MSMEAFRAFRERANSDAALAGEVKAVWDSNGDMAALARRHGFDVTHEELAEGWELAQEGELSPIELELVSGGMASEGQQNKNAICNNGV
jgi:predicted ribosomally synthesized peptide with nif11-like leader